MPAVAGFLAVIIDLYSRKVVGWAMADRLDAELSGSLRRALASRRLGAGFTFHSDRGSEFAASSFRKILGEAGAIQGMSRKGVDGSLNPAESDRRGGSGAGGSGQGRVVREVRCSPPPG